MNVNSLFKFWITKGLVLAPVLAVAIGLLNIRLGFIIIAYYLQALIVLSLSILITKISDKIELDVFNKYKESFLWFVVSCLMLGFISYGLGELKNNASHNEYIITSVIVVIMLLVSDRVFSFLLGVRKLVIPVSVVLSVVSASGFGTMLGYSVFLLFFFLLSVIKYHLFSREVSNKGELVKYGDTKATGHSSSVRYLSLIMIALSVFLPFKLSKDIHEKAVTLVTEAVTEDKSAEAVKNVELSLDNPIYCAYLLDELYFKDVSTNQKKYKISIKERSSKYDTDPTITQEAKRIFNQCIKIKSYRLVFDEFKDNEKLHYDDYQEKHLFALVTAHETLFKLSKMYNIGHPSDYLEPKLHARYEEKLKKELEAKRKKQEAKRNHVEKDFTKIVKRVKPKTVKEEFPVLVVDSRKLTKMDDCNNKLWDLSNAEEDYVVRMKTLDKKYVDETRMKVGEICSAQVEGFAKGLDIAKRTYKMDTLEVLSKKFPTISYFAGY